MLWGAGFSCGEGPFADKKLWYLLRHQIWWFTTLVFHNEHVSTSVLWTGFSFARRVKGSMLQGSIGCERLVFPYFDVHNIGMRDCDTNCPRIRIQWRLWQKLSRIPIQCQLKMERLRKLLSALLNNGASWMDFKCAPIEIQIMPFYLYVMWNLGVGYSESKMCIFWALSQTYPHTHIHKCGCFG